MGKKSVLYIPQTSGYYNIEIEKDGRITKLELIEEEVNEE